MNYQESFIAIKTMYAFLLRPLLKKAIDDPDALWDDFVMARFDDLMDYTEDENG